MSLRHCVRICMSVPLSVCASVPWSLPGLRLPSPHVGLAHLVGPSPFLRQPLAEGGNPRPVHLPTEVGEVGDSTGNRYTRSSQVAGTAHIVLGMHGGLPGPRPGPWRSAGHREDV